MQHVGFTAAVDNASATVKSHASTVNATLTDAIAAIDRGIAAAQKIRAAGSAADAASAARELQPIIEEIGRGPSASRTGNAADDEGRRPVVAERRGAVK